jgi:hypothetical protein
LVQGKEERQKNHLTSTIQRILLIIKETQAEMGKQQTVNFKLNEYPNIQFEAGSMDRHTLKGCFLLVKGCLESLDENHKTNMFRFKKGMNGTISRFLNNNLFSTNYIQTESISDSFQMTGFSFSTFEFTFFPKKKLSVSEITTNLNVLIEDIYNEQIKENKIMKFHKNLKTKRDGKKR